MIQTLISLFIIFFQLSFLAFGGGNTIVPEMQRQVVEVEHWISAQEFTALFALAQAAPGPNLMIVPMLGWRIAGFAGLAVTSIANFLPSSIITVLAMRAWNKYKDHRWRPVIQAGLLPMTVGVIASTAFILVGASDKTPSATAPETLDYSWGLVAITAIAAAIAIRSRIHPLWILLAGALIGASGIGQ
ncbi:MAG TPA: chromate transporter [Burkholderiales bacterium]|jgi:chromate transporter